MERQNPAAPWLFDEHQLPVRPDVLQAVKDERYRHTGARLLDDEAKALRLVELLSAKWGVKRISREMGISKWTVIAARDVLVKRGQLAPYKERLVQIYEEIVETGALKYLVALENGKITPAQIPFGVGIFSDKRALALGEPTVIGAGASGPSQDDLSVDRLNRFFDNLPRVQGHVTDLPALPPADAQSSEQAAKPQEPAPVPAADATSDANAPR